MPATVLRREDLAPGAVLCDHCTAKCCRYFALPIDTPVDRDDYENIRWYMLHGDVSIFVDDGSWYLLIHNQCDHIDDQNRCGICEDRPTICRSYSTDSCEFDNDSCYDRLFELHGVRSWAVNGGRWDGRSIELQNDGRAVSRFR